MYQLGVDNTKALSDLWGTSRRGRVEKISHYGKKKQKTLLLSLCLIGPSMMYNKTTVMSSMCFKNTP